MVVLQQFFKILLLMMGSLTAIFILSLRFHRMYQRIPAVWRTPALCLIHFVNCIILLSGFFAAIHLREAYIHQYYLRTEVIHSIVTLVLLFMLGLPFIYFYTQSQLSLIKLESESYSHKLDIVNLMHRVMEEMPEELKEHASRTAVLTRDFCSFLKSESDLQSDIVFAAMFHNVGNALRGQPDASKSKVSGQDACLSASLFQRIHVYKNASEMILHRCERWDGSGTPNKLRGMDIPFGSRVIAIASSYDQHINSFKSDPKVSAQEALGKLKEGRGLAFDPDLLDQFNAYIIGTFSNQY